jgi:hypothetical protein
MRLKFKRKGLHQLTISIIDVEARVLLPVLRSCGKGKNLKSALLTEMLHFCRIVRTTNKNKNLHIFKSTSEKGTFTLQRFETR